MVCACQNGGNCTQPDNLSGDRFQVMSCTCGSGYTGKLCESNLDACDVNGPPCFPGVNCTDLPPPKGVDGYICGPCPAGYGGNGSSCTGKHMFWVHLNVQFEYLNLTKHDIAFFCFQISTSVRTTQSAHSCA
jgi:hypothetical protein